MQRPTSSLFFILALVIAAGARAGEPDVQVIRTGKAATALVAIPGKGIGGSAFCIDAGGFFLTTAHAVRDAGQTALSLVVNSGEETERTLPAKIVRLDQNLNLALLKASAPAAAPALEPGDESGLIETMQVIVFGYPLDDALAAKDGKYPAVNVNLARINAIRKARGQIQFLQLDTQLNAGNSGGAVLDAKGGIVGVVSPPIRGTETNLVIPINQLESFLAEPYVSFAAPSIAYARRHDAAEISMSILSFGRAKPKLTVEVGLSSCEDDHRTFDAAGGDNGVYAARIVPLPPRSTPTTMPATIDYPAGTIRCTIEDTAIKLDDRALRLWQLGRIEKRDGRVIVAGRDGREISGSRLEIGALKADFGGYITEIDPFKAVSLVIGQPAREADRIAYSIAVQREGKTVARSTGEIRLVGGDDATLDAPGATRPAATTGPATRPG